MIAFTDCGLPTTDYLPYPWAWLNETGPALRADGTISGSYSFGEEGSPVWTWRLAPRAEE